MAKRAPQKKLPAKSKTLSGRLKSSAESLMEEIENVFSKDPRNVESAIKMDHEGLRNFLKTLKDTDKPLAERKSAYASFSALLKSHTTAEEKIVYLTGEKLPGEELHMKIAEGFVEHHLADDLMKRIERCKDPTDWSAHCNVLSEIVEHHLKEEERDLLPLLKKIAPASTDHTMLTRFLALRKSTQKTVNKKNAGVLK